MTINLFKLFLSQKLNIYLTIYIYYAGSDGLQVVTERGHAVRKPIRRLRFIRQNRPQVRRRRRRKLCVSLIFFCWKFLLNLGLY